MSCAIQSIIKYVIILLGFLIISGRCSEVYLKEIKFETVHEKSFWDKTPEIYVSCDDSRSKIYLKKAQKPHVTYTYKKEELSITHIDDDTCRKCEFKEEDLITSDDYFGTVHICIDDFNENGIYSVHVKGQFDAKFSCGTCYQEPFNNTNNNQLIQTNNISSSETLELALPSSELPSELPETDKTVSNENDKNENIEEIIISSVTSIEENNEAEASVSNELPDNDTEYTGIKSQALDSNNYQNNEFNDLYVIPPNEEDDKSNSLFRCYMIVIINISIIFGSVTVILFYKAIKLMYQWKKDFKVKPIDVLTYSNDVDDDFDDLIEFQKIKNYFYYRKNNGWQKMQSDDPGYMNNSSNKN